MKEKIKHYWSTFRQWPLWKQLLLGVITIGLTGILSVLLLFLSVKWEITTDLPSEEALLAINNPISTDLYTREGKLFGKFFDENRGDLAPEDITEDFKNALLATEDVRFYDHHGLDYRALGRVFFKSILLQKDNSGGGSTLTQQLAKNLFPRKRFWALSLPMNKFREMVIAQRLEKLYEKDELILLYSNTISFGERAFGLYTASNRFFGKEPQDLSLEESACLVGLLKAPSYYSPRKYPDRCVQRRNTVLDQMKKYDFIAEEDWKNARESELILDYQSLSKSTGLARYFQQFVKKEFESWASDNPKENGDLWNINRDGLKITTSLDYELQLAAEQQQKKHMKKLQDIFNSSWKGGKKYGDKERIYLNELQQDSYYKVLKERGYAEKMIDSLLNQERKISHWTWEGLTEKTMSHEDSIKHYLSLLHSAVLAAHPKTGDILVYLGGNDYGQFQYDNIVSKRQVGSTFKPIVYLTAIKRGVSSCDYFPNERRIYSDYDDWEPQNSDGKYGGYLSVREAMTRSVNTISVQMIFKAGIDNVIKQARSLGITANLPEVPSLVLGTADISLKEMVTAYAGLANMGNAPTLQSILKIEDRDGNELYSRKKENHSTSYDSLSYQVLHDLMMNVTERGTAARLNNYDIPYPVMGKTGTTQQQTDGWFVGFTEELVVGAWVGPQNRGMHFRNLGTGSGGRTALPLVGPIFEFASSQGFAPKSERLDSIPFCLDSISQEEYAWLQENPQDFEGIIAQRRGEDRDILDILFGDGEVIVENRDRPSRKPRRTTRRQSKERTQDFEKFRKEVEQELRDLFRVKPKKKRKKRKRN